MLFESVASLSSTNSDAEEFNLTELGIRLAMGTMFFAFVWLFCLSVSSVRSNVDAFSSRLRRTVAPVSDRIQTLVRISDPTAKPLDFLSDLAPPFSVEVDDIPGMEEVHFEYPDVTHFCFLIHGHRGLSKDLRYMQMVMQKWAAHEKKRRNEPGCNDNSDPEGEECLLNSQPKHDMVVHNAVCNEGKTTDGVRNGGDRLVEEMLEVIDTEMKKRHQNSTENAIYDITVSVLGNSLGGLFGRYAIAKLVERHGVKENDREDACWILDGKYRLHLNVFCTTATPHLGISKHTYVPLPRTAEIGVAHALGDTGKDLFRLNSLLHTMATCPTYLAPLSNFRKRIAYANAYGTDFPVPASTAAFLSANSSYPHHFTEEYMVDDNGFVIATLHTPIDHNLNETDGTEANVVENSHPNDASNDNKVDDHDTELDNMSISLDKLGWKKVFIDIRREIPGLEIPKSFVIRRQRSDSRLLVENNHLRTLKDKKVVQSKDVATAMSQLPEDNRVSLPLGHNMMVAFSRSRLSTYMNKGGRPVVDALAKELVEDIFKFEYPDTTSKRKDDEKDKQS